jgi:cell growth-regulating nucleolar protein
LPNVFDFLIADGGESRRSLTPEDDDWDSEESDSDMHPEPTYPEPSYPEPPPYSEQDEFANVFQYQVPPSEFGADPVKPSWHPAPEQAFTTPAPSKGHSRNMSMESNTGAKKRKRGHPEDLDLSKARTFPPNGDIIMTDVPPALHSGLTGGINRMMARPEFPPSPDYSGGDGADASPQSPLKRSKTAEKEKDKSKLRNEKKSSKDRTKDKKEKKEKSKDKEKEKEKEKKKRRESQAKKGGVWVQERRRPHKRSASPAKDAPRKQLAIEYNPSPAEAVDNSSALIVHPGKEQSLSTRAELFTALVLAGVESDRGWSINKALKRYHRECGDRVTKIAEEKELWKVLRLRRNDRGEIVLFPS